MNDVTTPVEVDLHPDDGLIRVSRRGVCLPLTLAQARQVICEVIGVLLQHVERFEAVAAGRAVDLAVVEQVLYHAGGVVDPRQVPTLLATITAAGHHTTTTTGRPVAPAEPQLAPPTPPGRWS